ncbi:hypothetical protein C5B90_12715 [Haloferax sp. Atlit-12N]|uniref:zinc finger domain-containing protein n=1 Tax=Haloferax sp. Atlit-12N TaxID=2077203 RepID=UPI000E27F1EF|nr:zinc finger domain-containing protein [Haloferax sp. Atlit-12N]RDZ63964.1 hypothetical protein C5B90_12715 [Haloferax sp. Atlit-12N]
MTCPRCSQPLSTLSFDGRAARYCERCGFVGVETVHERDAPNRESWDDAIARFHARAVREAREREEVVAAGDEGGNDVSADGDNESADDDNEPADDDNESEPEGNEADAANGEAAAVTDESDATEGVADSGAVEADETGDSDAADRESSDYQRKNGEDGDRGDRTGDE